MPFSKAFEKLLDAIREGRVTDAHLEAFTADPNRVLAAGAASTIQSDRLEAPRAQITVTDLTRGKAALRNPVPWNGQMLQCAEWHGGAYLIAGEEVYGPYEAIEDLNVIEDKPFYRAKKNGAWQVFHGTEGSLPYQDVQFLTYADGSPLYAAQQSTGKWSVVHGTKLFRPFDEVRSKPRLLVGEPLYWARIDGELFVAHGDRSWGGYKNPTTSAHFWQLIEGDPIYYIRPDYSSGFRLFVGDRFVAEFNTAPKLLGIVDQDPLVIANEDGVTCVFHGSRKIAERVDPETCALKGTVLHAVQHPPRYLGLFRQDPRELHIDLDPKMPALPADVATGPYRALPAEGD